MIPKDSGAVLLGAVLLLVPAALNGHPFLFDDSLAYLGVSEAFFVPASRTPYYGLLLMLLHWRYSLWLAVGFQAVLSSWLVWLALRRLFSCTDRRYLVIAISLLSALSSLPWFVGSIMPDLYTSLMILAVAILAVSWQSTRWLDRVVLVVVVAGAISVHQANLLIAMCIVPAAVLFAVFCGPTARPLAHGFAALAGAMTVGVAALLLANFAGHGRVALSSGGSVFALARLLDDGPAVEYLTQKCPSRRYLTCSQLEHLKEHRRVIGDSHDPIVSISDHFLWQGPLDALGGFGSIEAEAREIVRGTLVSYPLESIGDALLNGVRQLFLIRTSDVMVLTRERQATETIDRIFGETAADRFRRSGQYRSEISGDWDPSSWRDWRDRSAPVSYDPVDRLHALVVILSLTGLLVVISSRRLANRPVAAAAYLLVCVLVNAMVMGALSGPHDRYQGRVVWLIPFALLGLVGALRTAKLAAATSRVDDQLVLVQSRKCVDP